MKCIVHPTCSHSGSKLRCNIIFTGALLKLKCAAARHAGGYSVTCWSASLSNLIFGQYYARLKQPDGTAAGLFYCMCSIIQQPGSCMVALPLIQKLPPHSLWWWAQWINNQADPHTPSVAFKQVSRPAGGTVPTPVSLHHKSESKNVCNNIYDVILQHVQSISFMEDRKFEFNGHAQRSVLKFNLTRCENTSKHPFHCAANRCCFQNKTVLPHLNRVWVDLNVCEDKSCFTLIINVSVSQVWVSSVGCVKVWSVLNPRCCSHYGCVMLKL